MAFIDEKIEPKPITSIISHAFTDYAMSVIVARAIPDVRDGLKPVHRRILYAMNELGMTSNKPHKKSARIVGEVIGKYHPHGDTSVYDAMVRMAQEWSYREPLIHGQGNFGNMDGDPAAAMRYTEARLSKIAGELLSGLHRDTVDYQPNFDEEEVEPVVLPARFPNLLVNGAEGIAVGMSTRIPPHNLAEVVRATIALSEHPELSTEELMTYISGPDFPTGALIMGTEGIKRAYETGRGSITLRAKTHIRSKGKKNYIVITEVPYQVNPEKLVADMKQIQVDWDHYMKEKGKKGATEKGFDFAVKDGINNYTDLSNEQNSVHIEIELKSHVLPEIVLQNLYKHTDLQTSFPIQNRSVVPRVVQTGKGKKTILEPRVLSLKDTLLAYLDHQVEVIRRGLLFDREKAQDKLHKMEGIMRALDQLDDTIAIIRSAKHKGEAREHIMTFLRIDEPQATAILDMQLHRLTSLDRQKQREEYDALQNTIKTIDNTLSSEELLKEVGRKDLREILETYGKERRTEIRPEAEDIDPESLMTNEEVVVTLTQNGFIKRTLESTYRTQRRKGMGVNAMGMYENDFIRHLHIARKKDTLLFFTDQGKVYKKKAWEIKEASKVSSGQHVKMILELEDGENIQAMLTVREFSDQQYLFFATKNGIVKKTPLSDYAHIRRNGIGAIRLEAGDRLVGVNVTSGKREVTLVTKGAMSITFSEEEVRPMGRIARGVKGMHLKPGDEVISFSVHEEKGELLIATDAGVGKRIPVSHFRVQARGGKGVICTKLQGENTEVVGSEFVQGEDQLMLITKNGTLMRVKISEISTFGRNAQGTKIMHLRKGDMLRAVARIADTEEALPVAEE